MLRRSSIDSLPIELLTEIATSIRLHATPSTLLSLAITNHTLYDNIYPFLYSQVILRNKGDAMQAITKILDNPKLGRHVRGLHIMYNPIWESKLNFDVTAGVERLISRGLLPYLRIFAFYALSTLICYYPKGCGRFSANFWGNLVEKCPLVKDIVVSGPEVSFFIPWIQESRADELRTFSVSPTEISTTRKTGFNNCHFIESRQNWT